MSTNNPLVLKWVSTYRNKLTKGVDVSKLRRDTTFRTNLVDGAVASKVDSGVSVRPGAVLLSASAAYSSL